MTAETMPALTSAHRPGSTGLTGPGHYQIPESTPNQLQLRTAEQLGAEIIKRSLGTLAQAERDLPEISTEYRIRERWPGNEVPEYVRNSPACADSDSSGCRDPYLLEFDVTVWGNDPGAAWGSTPEDATAWQCAALRAGPVTYPTTNGMESSSIAWDQSPRHILPFIDGLAEACPDAVSTSREKVCAVSSKAAAAILSGERAQSGSGEVLQHGNSSRSIFDGPGSVFSLVTDNPALGYLLGDHLEALPSVPSPVGKKKVVFTDEKIASLLDSLRPIRPPSTDGATAYAIEGVKVTFVL